jgi:hypothetical protein
LRLGKVLELQDDRVDVSDEDVVYKSHACGDFDGVLGDLVGLESGDGRLGRRLTPSISVKTGIRGNGPSAHGFVMATYKKKIKSQRSSEMKGQVESKMESVQKYLKGTKSRNNVQKLMRRRLIQEYNKSYMVLVQWGHSIKFDLLIGYEYVLVRDSDHSESQSLHVSCQSGIP